MVLLEVHNETIRIERQNLGIDMVLVDNDGLDFLVANEPVSDQTAKIGRASCRERV